MALDCRNFRVVADKTLLIAINIGIAEVIARFTVDLKGESDPYRIFVVETVEKVAEKETQFV